VMKERLDLRGFSTLAMSASRSYISLGFVVADSPDDDPDGTCTFWPEFRCTVVLAVGTADNSLIALLGSCLFMYVAIELNVVLVVDKGGKDLMPGGRPPTDFGFTNNDEETDAMVTGGNGETSDLPEEWTFMAELNEAV